MTKKHSMVVSLDTAISFIEQMQTTGLFEAVVPLQKDETYEAGDLLVMRALNSTVVVFAWLRSIAPLHRGDSKPHWQFTAGRRLRPVSELRTA